jgi:hypothetical protein
LDSPAEGYARIGRHDVSPDQRDASSDRQVDEEDRAPVGNLGEDAAEQDADGGAGAADCVLVAERSRPLRAPEARRDDRQRCWRQHRRAEPWRARAANSAVELTARADASDAAVKTLSRRRRRAGD